MSNNQSPVNFSSNTPTVQSESLDAIRSQLANTTLLASLVISFFALIASVCRGIFLAGQETALFHVFLFLTGSGLIIFYRRLPYLLRASLIPVILSDWQLADHPGRAKVRL